MKKLLLTVLSLIAATTCPMDVAVLSGCATDQLVQEVCKRDPNLDVVRLLLDFGADKEALAEPNQTLLLHACGSNKLPLARLLIQNGADCSARDKMRNTPLIHIALWSRTLPGNQDVLDTARLLVGESDIDLYAVNQLNKRASDYAGGQVAVLLRNAMGR